MGAIALRRTSQGDTEQQFWMKKKSKHVNLAQQNGFEELHGDTEQQILDGKKVKTRQFGSTKWFCLSIFAHDDDGKKAQQSLTPILDWLDYLIGPDGLLFVVPRTFRWASQIQFCMLEVEEKKYLPTM
jgi:hypothetical protein